MEDINWLALIVASLSTLVVGFIWYNPKVFGKAWMEASGMTEEKIKGGNMALIFGLSLVLAFLISVFLQGLVFNGGEHGTEQFTSFKHGAFHGAILCLFVVMPALVTNSMYERKGIKYMLINVGYWLVSMIVMGGIINVWP